MDLTSRLVVGAGSVVGAVLLLRYASRTSAEAATAKDAAAKTAIEHRRTAAILGSGVLLGPGLGYAVTGSATGALVGTAVVGAAGLYVSKYGLPMGK